MGIKRRDFLKQGALLIAAASQAGWITKAVTAPDEPKPEHYPGTGIETWKSSVCRLCPGGCGIRVRLVDGRPVKIEGNPRSPVNRGGLCPAGHSGLQVLLNPDRIKTPLKRVGERGENRWQPIDWDEAFTLLYDYLIKLRNEKAPHHLLVLDGGSRGLQSQLIRQFLNAFGSPNFISLTSAEQSVLPFLLMQGTSQLPAYDYARTKFILSFGNDFLDSEGPPTRMAYLFGQLRQNPGHERIKIVHVDPRFSVTAAKADKWVPINPGTYGALALGIAHILVVEGLFNQAFVEKHTFGFEDWVDEHQNSHKGFRSLLLKDYYPEKVSEITGVPINDIIRIARSFAHNQPGIAIWGQGVFHHSNSLYSQMAVNALNALVGSIGIEGGIVETPPPPPSSLPPVRQDALAKWGTSQERIDRAREPHLPGVLHGIGSLIDNILSGEPYPVEIALLINTNPVFELPDRERIVKALKKIPFLVSFSSFPDETTQFADLVLPDHTYLEKWDLDYEVPHLPFTQVTLSQPVVSPRLNTRHIGDVFLTIARRLGVDIRQSLPVDNYAALVKSQAQAIYQSRRGFITSSKFEDFMQGFLTQRGFKYQEFATFNDFWQAFQKFGSWLEISAPVGSALRKMKTPSGKFEFYSQRLFREFRKAGIDTGGGEDAPLPIAGVSARGDEIYLPHFEPPTFHGDPDQFPLHLFPFSILTLFDGNGANRPMLMEMVGFRRQTRWNSWAEINPETAREIGIHDGDWICVESEVGKVRVRAKLFPGAMPGMVYLPLGLGHTAYGRYARGKGVNPNHLVVFATDPLGGNVARGTTRVKVYKVSMA